MAQESKRALGAVAYESDKMMFIGLKYLLIFIIFTSIAQAKVGVCEVLPDVEKDKYLACLVKEAERTDDVADINMVAEGYGVYAMGEEIMLWREKAIEKGSSVAMYNQAKSYAHFVKSKYDLKYGLTSIPSIIEKTLLDYPQKNNQPKKAISLYKQAALKEYKDSIAKLSELMQIVYGKEGAVKEYKKEMAEGDKNTYRFLANLYVRYEDYDKALELYESALKREDINKGDVYALIGSLYEAHYRDKKEAKIYYEKAAKEGNAVAMYNLGIMAGNKKDYNKAEEWFRASEKAGNEYALGMICYMNYSQENDYEKAEECNIELAREGNAEEMFETGIFLLRRVAKEKEGFYWLKKAYEAGSSSAAIVLGAEYRNKYKNKEKAIYWYKKAAAMGEPGGWSYLYGEGAL
ncbi:tetratricopeptide repeat protein [Sulfurimonas sp.]|uniref:tetratricopeptide repeat protein n=1 Tax=Sulfurimonas sp. TaxID=2022749 RepID=UPI002B49D652|nr:tetratricopeptide repeat protein [Sulfurimonas sp.]